MKPNEPMVQPSGCEELNYRAAYLRLFSDIAALTERIETAGARISVGEVHGPPGAGTGPRRGYGLRLIIRRPDRSAPKGVPRLFPAGEQFVKDAGVGLAGRVQQHDRPLCMRGTSLENACSSVGWLSVYQST